MWRSALFGVLAFTAAAEAREITLAGITFSDELGGVTLLEGSGSGHLDDPFVLIEDIDSTGPAVLVVRGLDAAFGNRIGSHHGVGFALVKIIRNRTPRPWRHFDIELQESLGDASPYEDGLSFGQATTVGRPFRADRFARVDEHDEPADGVSFSDGEVAPGARLTLGFVVTDTTPVARFYLLQRRGDPLAGDEATPALALEIGGLDTAAGLANHRRPRPE